MIYTEQLFKILKKYKINFFTGVPDSVLKSLSIHLKDYKNHIIAANEGTAVSMVIGYHLATKKIGCVYMQNSGLGNSINPLISIADQKVYSIPMLIIIGWRGAPKIKDEPQHVAKGKITLKLLKLLGIDHCILENKNDLVKLEKIIKRSKKFNRPVACLIKNKTLKTRIKETTLKKNINNGLLRKDLILNLLNCINKNDDIISTTGFTSRELNQLRKLNNFKKGKDFYMVGGMGHAASVSLTRSMFKKNKNTICLDGDGSLIMHMGSLSTIGFYGKNNFKHILLNNFSHESVGGQNTNSQIINFKNLSLSLGYKNYFRIHSKKNIKKKINNFLKSKGPSFLEVKINNGIIENLNRPKNLKEIKSKFIG